MNILFRFLFEKNENENLTNSFFHFQNKSENLNAFTNSIFVDW